MWGKLLLVCVFLMCGANFGLHQRNCPTHHTAPGRQTSSQQITLSLCPHPPSTLYYLSYCVCPLHHHHHYDGSSRPSRHCLCSARSDCGCHQQRYGSICCRRWCSCRACHCLHHGDLRQAPSLTPGALYPHCICRGCPLFTYHRHRHHSHSRWQGQWPGQRRSQACCHHTGFCYQRQQRQQRL